MSNSLDQWPLRWLQMSASLDEGKRSLGEALSALQKLDESMGAIQDALRSYVGLWRRLQHEAKQKGQQSEVQDSVNQIVSQVNEIIRKCEEERAAVFKARKSLGRLRY